MFFSRAEQHELSLSSDFGMKRLPDSNFLARQWWNAERFGFTPAKLKFRMSNAGMPRIVCISIPKAGTHLIERVLCKHPRLYRPLIKTIDEANTTEDTFNELISRLRPGQIVFSHLFYTPGRERLLKENGVHCIFIVRDLRDIVVSEANYLSSTPGHIYHAAFADAQSTKDRVLRSLQGNKQQKLPSMAQLFE